MSIMGDVSFALDIDQIIQECLFGVNRDDYKQEVIDEEDELERDTPTNPETVKKDSEIIDLTLLTEEEDTESEPSSDEYDEDLIIPRGFEKMKKNELIDSFLSLNKGKKIPEYLMKNLQEADYSHLLTEASLLSSFLLLKFIYNLLRRTSLSCFSCPESLDLQEV